jgi:hypothetical protein
VAYKAGRPAFLTPFLTSPIAIVRSRAVAHGQRGVTTIMNHECEHTAVTAIVRAGALVAGRKCLGQVGSSRVSMSRVVSLGMNARPSGRLSGYVAMKGSYSLYLLLAAALGVSAVIIGQISSADCRGVNDEMAINGSVNDQWRSGAALNQTSQICRKRDRDPVAPGTQVPQWNIILSRKAILADALTSFKRGLTAESMIPRPERPSMTALENGVRIAPLHLEWSRTENNAGRER